MIIPVTKSNIITLSTLNQALQKIPAGLSPISSNEHTRIQWAVEYALAYDTLLPMKIHKRDVGLDHSILILKDKTPVLLMPTKHIIGQGSYNTVTWGIHLLTGQMLAVSRFRFHDKFPPTLSEKEQFNKELKDQFTPGLQRLQECQGDNIVSFIGNCTSKNRKGVLRQKLVIEYCPEGDLHNAIPRLSPEEKRQVVSDLLGGVAHISSKNIVHSDVKPLNVLLSEARRAKVTDLEFAAPVGSTLLGGSYEYLPPEFYPRSSSSRCRLSEKTDAWALGITLFELLAPSNAVTDLREYLFPWGTQHSMMRVLNGSNQFILDDFIIEYTPQEYHNLLRSLLKIYPHTRSSVADALAAWKKSQAGVTSDL